LIETRAVTSIAAVLWTKANGLWCVVRPYDETRYQLRLMWNDETVRADLFEAYNQALAAAETWRTAAEAQGAGDAEST
jgi:hypothetical protein